jgi:DNA polymerase (family 10)
MRLTRAGLWKNGALVAARTEQDIYLALGLPYLAPEIREGSEEIELGRRGELPRLISPGSLRGDLQIHTNWGDGCASIEEMALAARGVGREYIALADPVHAGVLGLDAPHLRMQIAEARKLSARGVDCQVLCGAELDILLDGSLGLEPELLDELDFIGVALRSDFEQSRSVATLRVVRALENPRVAEFLLPTCRASGQRLPLDLDLDAVIATACRTGTALGIDSRAERAEQREAFIREAVRAGAKLLVNSDARAPAELQNADRYGVAAARRGSAGRSQVLNTLPLAQFLNALKPWPRPITSRAPKRRTTMVRRRASQR